MTNPPPDSRSILVVEDNGPMRNLLAFVCQRNGLRVATAGTVAEGMAKLKLLPDLLVLDLDLPDGSGAEILRRVRERGMPVRVAVITALAQPTLMDAVLKMQPDRFLPKPFDLKDLVAWLRLDVASAA